MSQARQFLENKTKKVSPSLIAVYVVLVVLAVVWLLPVIYTVTTSFKSVAEFTSNAFNFLPAKWVLDNYMTLIEASASYPVLNWLGNSLDYLDRVRSAVRVHRRARRLRLFPSELQVPRYAVLRPASSSRCSLPWST